ncbi:MAG: ABC transporter ATP-binding protein [Treponema sp.]|nr:ABC transporter ATP-binding protein [Treponema sp.]
MIEVKNISFSYPKNEVVRDVSFQALEGECVGILGNNGAGKSTLITCLNRILPPKTGEVLIEGQDVLKMSRLESARRISYVAQKNEISQMTVFDTVLLGRKPYFKWTLSTEDLDICRAMIAQMGLEPFTLRYTDELSGGELQKVMLARALVQEPKLLLLDEPTSNLDPKNQYEMLALIKDLARQKNIAVLIVIHDLSLALRFCDKFLFLKKGQVYSFGDESVLTEETLYQVYGIRAEITEVRGRKIILIN